MATFEVRVEGLTGLSIDASSNPTQDELTEYLKDGVIEITDRIIALKPEEVDKFMRSTTSDSQGVDVGSAKVISVMREANADGSSDGSTSWRDCKKVSSSLQSRLVDSTSLHFSSIYNPAYIRENNSVINVYPTPSSDNGIKVFYVNEEPRDITNNASLVYSHSNIKYFPNDKVYLVVLYAGIKSLENALAGKNTVLETSLLPNDIVFDTITSSLPSYTSPDSFILPVGPPGVDVDFSSIGSILSFVAPVFSAPAIGTIGTITLPVSPTAPTNVVQSVNLPSTEPSYTQPVFNVPATPTFDDLVLPVPPASPSDPSFSTLTIDDINVSILAAPPTFTAPKVGGATEELTTIMDADSAGSGTDDDFLNFSKWFSVVGEYIEDEEDLDLAQAQLGKIQAYVQAYAEQLKTNQSTFNEQAAEYQAQLQTGLKKADLDAAKSIQEKNFAQQKEFQEYTQILTKYQNDIGKYSAEVNTAIQQWMQEEYTPKYTTWITEFNSGIQKHTADIQNALNVFNKENAIYQAEVQESLQEAQLAESKEARDIQKYAQQVISYQNEINKEIQRWTGEEFNKEMNEWKQNYQGQLSEYDLDVKKETSRITASLNAYQVEVDKALKKYQAETGYDVTLYQANIQAEISKFQSNLSEQKQDFESNLQKYAAEVQNITSINQNKVADYSAKVQKSQIRLQQYQMDYGWMEARLAKIQAEYDSAFSIIGAKLRQQQQQQQQQVRR